VAQDDFVRLMRERPELCREATEMLGREVTFIQSALAERRKHAASRKLSLSEVLTSSVGRVARTSLSQKGHERIGGLVSSRLRRLHCLQQVQGPQPNVLS
jgi:hypothetical protein